MSSEQIPYQYELSCTYNTMPMELFMKLASQELKDKFLFNLAEIEFKRGPAKHKIQAEMIEWLCTQCEALSVFSVDESIHGDKMKIYFENQDDLMKFKLTFDI